MGGGVQRAPLRVQRHGRRGRGPGPAGLVAVLLVAVPFLAGGVAGLLQTRPLVAVPLLLVGAAVVSAGALAQARERTATTQALGHTPAGVAGEAAGISNLPDRTRLFTGREAELARLLKGTGRVAVVAAHGLGGIGKTQLALAYSHRHEQAFAVRWWIRAGSRLTVVADLAAARQLHQQALEVRRRTLGPEHPTTLGSMNNLALVLRAQGDLAAARQLHQQALEVLRRILGPEHPTTLGSMNNLAAVLEAQGAQQQAEQLRQEFRAAQ